MGAELWPVGETSPLNVGIFPKKFYIHIILLHTVIFIIKNKLTFFPIMCIVLLLYIWEKNMHSYQYYNIKLEITTHI